MSTFCISDTGLFSQGRLVVDVGQHTGAAEGQRQGLLGRIFMARLLTEYIEPC